MKLPSPSAAVPRCAAGSAPRRRPPRRGSMRGGRCSSASRPSGCSTACSSTSRSCTPRRSARCWRRTAAGNPAVIARPITWDATLVEHHLVLLNTIFATIQLLLGLGIAFRPTVRLALAASIAWSLGVWWFGEGLGGVLNGGADPLNGAPGAVILYALLAVLLWPADRPGRPAPFVAARAVGAHRGPGAVAGAVAEPGLLRADSRPTGPRRRSNGDDRGHEQRRAGLAGRDLARRAPRSWPARGSPRRSSSPWPSC